MKRWTLTLVILAMVFVGACAAPPPTPIPPTLETPTVELHQIEVVAHAWQEFPSTSSMALTYQFSVTNPNDFSIMLSGISFVTEFEGSPIGLSNDYIPVGKATTNEKVWIPPRLTNYVKVTCHYDSQELARLLEITASQYLIEQGKSTKDIEPLLKAWWLQVPSSVVKLRIVDPVFEFTSNYGEIQAKRPPICYPCLPR